MSWHIIIMFMHDENSSLHWSEYQRNTPHTRLLNKLKLIPNKNNDMIMMVNQLNILCVRTSYFFIFLVRGS